MNSLLFRGAGTPRSGMFPARSRKQVGSVNVSADSALRHSAVWASLRLRADLLSSMPVDVFRKAQGVDIEVPTPPVLLNPGGSEEWDIGAWLWATQYDLDRVGNAFGIITHRDRNDRPAVIELADHKDVTAVMRKGELSYRIKGKRYEKEDIWHERQYLLPGQVMGLSAISYAAYSIGLYLSAQEFGIEWFANGGAVPSGHLKNTKKTLDDVDTDKVKERFRVAVSDRDVFVTGDDWEYKTLDVAAKETQFLESQDASAIDIGRFIGVPADLIDLAIKGQSVTYANITQRNLQFLIMNLWPTVRRRQTALKRLVGGSRYVRLNTEAILQLDPETKAKVLGMRTRDRNIAPSEVRALYDQQPFTEEQLAEFDVLFPKGQPSKSITIGD